MCFIAKTACIICSDKKCPPALIRSPLLTLFRSHESSPFFWQIVSVECRPVQQPVVTMDTVAETYESDKVFDSSPELRIFKYDDNRRAENEELLVEAGRFLFTNSILTVNLLPSILFGIVAFASFAFFLWLMGYDLVSFCLCSEFESNKAFPR